MAALFGDIALYVLFITSVIYCIGLFLWEEPLLHYRKLVAGIHLTLVVLVLSSLYTLIFTNNFEYYYVWHHSAIDLPFWYKVSCLWEGQEGSFLLWMFWMAVFIFVITFSNNVVQKNALKFLIAIQIGLLSMVLGFVIHQDIVIGSSPFVLLKDVIQSEVYTIRPNFIPSDGKGLNALLQNYWMVIHPPVIFLGFTFSSFPFAMCLGALYKKEVTKWVRPALPWLLSAILCIGMGMLMGAFWAYETLNFGGFWNWDPVENAVYIPWLVLIATLHLIVVYLKKKKGMSELVVLALSSFLLVLYSTFLTRSGVLGNTSVHSFTDLGLSKQLVVFLLFFIVISAWCYHRSSGKFLSKTTGRTYGFDFWVSLGVMVILLSAFQVFLPTSFPVFNAMAESIGYNLKLAPPVNQVQYYTSFQLWFAVAIMLVTVIGQLVYRGFNAFQKVLFFCLKPLLFSFITFVLFLLVYGNANWQYNCVLLVGAFAFYTNLFLFISQYKSQKTIGGSLSHIGFVVLVVGILLSQGYQKVITESENLEGRLNSKGNVLLMQGVSVHVNDHTITYDYSFYELHDDRVKKSVVKKGFNPAEVEVLEPTKVGALQMHKGDVLFLNTVNLFYSILMKHENEVSEITPRVQQNSKMGIIASPFILRGFFSDVYTHVSNFPDPSKSGGWSNAMLLSLKKGLPTVVDGDSLKLIDVNTYQKDNEVILKSVVEVVTTDTSYYLTPIIKKTEEQIDLIPASSPNKEIQLAFSGEGINGEYRFALLKEPKDWITVKTIEFPLMSLVWAGGMLLLVGVTYSLFHSLKKKLEKGNKVVKIDKVVTKSLVHLIEN